MHLSAKGSGANLIVTIDEEQQYTATWNGDPKRLDDSIYAKNVSLTSPSGQIFKLTVSDDGTLSTVRMTE